METPSPASNAREEQGVGQCLQGGTQVAGPGQGCRQRGGGGEGGLGPRTAAPESANYEPRRGLARDGWGGAALRPTSCPALRRPRPTRPPLGPRVSVRGGRDTCGPPGAPQHGHPTRDPSQLLERLPGTEARRGGGGAGPVPSRAPAWPPALLLLLLRSSRPTPGRAGQGRRGRSAGARPDLPSIPRRRPRAQAPEGGGQGRRLPGRGFRALTSRPGGGGGCGRRGEERRASASAVPTTPPAGPPGSGARSAQAPPPACLAGPSCGGRALCACARVRGSGSSPPGHLSAASVSRAAIFPPPPPPARPGRALRGAEPPVAAVPAAQAPPSATASRWA